MAMQILSGPKKKKKPNHLLPPWERIPVKHPDYLKPLGRQPSDKEIQQFHDKRKAIKNRVEHDFLTKTPLISKVDEFLDWLFLKYLFKSGTKRIEPF